MRFDDLTLLMNDGRKEVSIMVVKTFWTIRVPCPTRDLKDGTYSEATRTRVPWMKGRLLSTTK